MGKIEFLEAVDIRANTIRRQMRDRVTERDGPNCFWCGRLTFEEVWVDNRLPDNARTLDHLIPAGKGSARKDGRNCVIACQRCNKERGSLSLAAYAAVVMNRLRAAVWA